MSAKQLGFTLIELMIVVVIVAILASIAYPSYTEFVRRSNRAGAKTAMLENAQYMERIFTMSNRYNQDSAGNAIDSTSLPVQQFPPAGEGTAKYNITVAPTATAFILSATPVAGSPAAGDGCGTFTLTNTGVKAVSGSKTVAECWSK
jgi:type IV pilus assembly protein PilE